MVIRLERGADLHMAQLMPLPLAVSCFSNITSIFPITVVAKNELLWNRRSGLVGWRQQTMEWRQLWRCVKCRTVNSETRDVTEIQPINTKHCSSWYDEEHCDLEFYLQQAKDNSSSVNDWLKQHYNTYLIHWVVVLRPMQHKIGHFRDVSTSQSLGLAWKKQNPQQQKLAFANQNKKEMYCNTIK